MAISATNIYIFDYAYIKEDRLSRVIVSTQTNYLTDLLYNATVVKLFIYRHVQIRKDYGRNQSKEATNFKLKSFAYYF